MATFIVFLTANWAIILGAITAAATLFAIIAKLTPTPKDDKIAAGILNALNLLPQSAKESYEEKKNPAPPSGPTPIMEDR